MDGYSTIEIMGIVCWTPTVCAKAAGVHKNTILHWIDKTKNGEMDMPIIGGKIKGGAVFIPREKFKKWYLGEA